jgi:molybdopterin-guanine dinucleotide biosynthesis protein A
MGREKAFLRLGRRVLIVHAIRLVRPLKGETFIVGAKEKFGAYGRTLQDIYPNCGPLGGIHAALMRSETELNLMIPVDMPFVRSEYLFKLAEVARSTNAMVTVTKTDRGLQPLCSIYRPGFKQLAEKALKAGDYKIDRLFGEGTCIVDACRLGYDPAMFDNLNTPEDYQRAAAFFSEQPQVAKS